MWQKIIHWLWYWPSILWDAVRLTFTPFGWSMSNAVGKILLLLIGYGAIMPILPTFTLYGVLIPPYVTAALPVLIIFFLCNLLYAPIKRDAQKNTELSELKTEIKKFKDIDTKAQNEAYTALQASLFQFVRFNAEGNGVGDYHLNIELLEARNVIAQHSKNILIPIEIRALLNSIAYQMGLVFKENVQFKHRDIDIDIVSVILSRPDENYKGLFELIGDELSKLGLTPKAELNLFSNEP